MKALSHFSGNATLRCGVIAMIVTFAASGQTLINLGTQGRNIDFSNAPATRPVKTGSSLPATCQAGELFFNLAAPAGQNLYACVATNTWALLGSGSGSGSGLADPGSNGLVVRTGTNTTTAVAAPTGTVVGTTDTQTLVNKTVDGVNPSTFVFLDATSSIQTQLNGKQATLSFTGTGSKTVSATGQGVSGHCAQWTAAGDIGDAGAACGTGGSGGGATAAALASGTLTNLPAACTTGAVYFATDQPAGQQLYTCSAPNTWTQVLSLGPSGALTVSNGSLDIVTSVVPRLQSANVFLGLNAFNNGLQLTTAATTTQPSCNSSALRGLLWYINNGTAKDGLQVCVYNGSSYGWVSLY